VGRRAAGALQRPVDAGAAAAKPPDPAPHPVHPRRRHEQPPARGARPEGGRRRGEAQQVDAPHQHQLHRRQYLAIGSDQGAWCDLLGCECFACMAAAKGAPAAGKDATAHLDLPQQSASQATSRQVLTQGRLHLKDGEHVSAAAQQRRQRRRRPPQRLYLVSRILQRQTCM
jgi:hypothetical protein